MKKFSRVLAIGFAATLLYNSPGEASKPSNYLTRTTRLPGGYVLAETLDSISSIPRDFKLSRNGVVLLNVPWPSLLKAADYESDSEHQSEPKLVYTTQSDAGDIGLNIVLLTKVGKPKFLLKNFPCREPSENADRTFSVEDLGMGVNLDPGSTTIDDRFPMVQIKRRGDSYVPDSESMRLDPAHATIEGYMKEVAAPLKYSFTHHSDRTQAPPLTPIVLSRIYELIYIGEAKEARRLLDVVYPNEPRLQMDAPTDAYFDANRRELKQVIAESVDKNEAWKRIVEYLRKHSKYLPTLKQLNPGLL